MEHWITVEGTDGALEVSNQGRVRSNLRDGRILKPTPDKKGYLRLRVTIGRKKYSFKVHRLVAEAFIPNPEGKKQVNHIDGNKANNTVSNLEWVSNKENAYHAMRNGLWDNVYEASRKENESRKRAITAFCLETGELLHFESIADAERALGTRHITDVLKGKRSQAKGYAFSYEEGGDVNVHTKLAKA